MLPDPKIKCPATGFARTCREILAECDCPKFVSIKGHDPQTGVAFDRHGCVDSFLALIMIENTQVTRHASSETHELRNDIQKANEDAATERRQTLLAFAKAGGPQLVLK